LQFRFVDFFWLRTIILWCIGGDDAPKKHKATGSNDLFRARLDQIINLKHELFLLTGKIDGDGIDGDIAPL
jgi:hypothetical protein